MRTTFDADRYVDYVILLPFILKLLIFLCTYMFILISFNMFLFTFVLVSTQRSCWQNAKSLDLSCKFYPYAPDSLIKVRLFHIHVFKYSSVNFLLFLLHSFRLISIVSFELGHVMAKITFLVTCTTFSLFFVFKGFELWSQFRCIPQYCEKLRTNATDASTIVVVEIPTTLTLQVELQPGTVY